MDCFDMMHDYATLISFYLLTEEVSSSQWPSLTTASATQRSEDARTDRKTNLKKKIKGNPFVLYEPSSVIPGRNNLLIYLWFKTPRML